VDFHPLKVLFCWSPACSPAGYRARVPGSKAKLARIRRDWLRQTVPFCAAFWKSSTHVVLWYRLCYYAICIFFDLCGL